MFKELAFKNPDKKYSRYCFLFLNDKFKAVHMEKMLEEFEKKGLSLGYLQDRGIADNKFLTDGYFETTKKLAARADIPFGLCDEGSGMYGRSCMDADIPRAVSLLVKKKEISGGYTVPECFFAVSFKLKNEKINNSTLKLLKSNEIENENSIMYIFNKFHDRSLSESNIDYLNPKTAEVIINEVYEKIKKNLSEFFGSKISGIFMDIEGDFGYKLAYSDRLLQMYRQLFDDDMLINMAAFVRRGC